MRSFRPRGYPHDGAGRHAWGWTRVYSISARVCHCKGLPRNTSRVMALTWAGTDRYPASHKAQTSLRYSGAAYCPTTELDGDQVISGIPGLNLISCLPIRCTSEPDHDARTPCAGGLVLVDTDIVRMNSCRRNRAPDAIYTGTSPALSLLTVVIH